MGCMTVIALRPMEDTAADYAALQRWFHEPELREWVWCDEKGELPVSLARVVEKYRPRVIAPTGVFPYMILQDEEPIGFIQYYLADSDIGIDMWIGVPDARNRGSGTEALRQMVRLILQNHPAVGEIFIDPAKENHRAIRCYQKAGFVIMEEMEDDGEPCWRMVLES